MNKIPPDGNLNHSDDPRQVYADIIDLPHHDPSPQKHPRMSLDKRAAQFAPFAALSGYEEMIREESRAVDVSHQRKLEESEAEQLNQDLSRLRELTRKGLRPVVTFTVFEPDQRKSGGRYVMMTEAVKCIDPVTGQIELLSTESNDPLNRNRMMNRKIQINRISRIEIQENQT